MISFRAAFTYFITRNENDHNEITSATSFISDCIMLTVIRNLPGTEMKIFLLPEMKSHVNTLIDNVKVKFLIDTGSGANILCYETLNEISKLNMNNYKLKKTSIKLIPFGSTSQNDLISVKGALSVLLETEEHFANALFYVIEGNDVTNIISGDLAIQLGLVTLHNKATSKIRENTIPFTITRRFNKFFARK